MPKDKKRITGVIEEILERKPDSESGWGKYVLYLEGHDEEIKVDVPEDVNDEYDLEEGLTVTLAESNFPNGAWVLHSKSEFITGEAFNMDGYSSGAGSTTATRSRRGTRKTEGTKARTSRRTTTTTARKKRGSTVTSARSSGGSDWNTYQKEVRDPQIKQQELLKIVSNIHIACLNNGLSPDDASALIDVIADDANRLDEILG